MTHRKHRIAFICTGNSCRSQMAEALLRHIGSDHFEAYSAGSQPAGYIHPLATETMERMGVPVEGQRSKSWNELTNIDFDAVITLCDSAASEPCPLWPGSPLTIHWSLPDPAFHLGSPDEQREFALAVAHRIREKLLAMIDLDFGVPRAGLQALLSGIGEI